MIFMQDLKFQRLSQFISLALILLNTQHLNALPRMGYFMQSLNPQNQFETRKFKQRYVVDDRYTDNKQSPVLYYICGEDDCFGQLKQSPFPANVEYLAKKYHAYMVALEHRYFGESNPMGQKINYEFKYLNMENGLLDLVHFKFHLQRTMKLTGPWVSYGASYAGNLSAYLRMRYPSQFVGAIASSAPVRHQILQNGQGKILLKQYTGQCKERIDQFFEFIQRGWDSQVRNQIHLIINKDLSKSAIKIDDLYTHTWYRLIINNIQSGSIIQFCQSYSQTDIQKKNDEYLKFIISTLNVEIDLHNLLTSKTDSEDIIFDNYFFWRFIACNEFGGFETEFNDSRNDDELNQSLDPIRFSQCKKYNIEHQPRTRLSNKKYYDLFSLPKVSNILFINGDQDPWHYLSILPNQVKRINPQLDSYLIEGGTHGEDLWRTLDSQNTQQMNQALQLIEQKVGEWLKIDQKK